MPIDDEIWPIISIRGLLIREAKQILNRSIQKLMPTDLLHSSRTNVITSSGLSLLPEQLTGLFPSDPIVDLKPLAICILP